MAVKRDYGNFSKAVQKILPPLVVPHGYEHSSKGFFARKRAGWHEGFFLQQTQWGGGEFCINIGIEIPSLNARWLAEDTNDHGLFISFRLSERGADQGDCWLPAENKQQLTESLELVASWLPLVEPWYAQFVSISDVARVYRSRTNLVEPGENNWYLQLMAANYGFLLAEAGEATEARRWLKEAERLMSLPVYHVPNGGMVHEKVKGARLQKPSDSDLRQLEAVRRSLDKFIE